MEDWKAVEDSLGSIEKALWVVGFPTKQHEHPLASWGWIFLTALKMNIDSILHEQHIFALEQEPHGLEEPSISYSKAVSEGDDDDECYETVGPCLTVRRIVQQKVKHEQPMAPRGASSRGLQYD